MTEGKMQELAEVIIREAKKGNYKFMEMAISLNENFKNRELKARQKQAEASTKLADHIANIKVDNTLDIPVTPYEELGRQPE